MMGIDKIEAFIRDNIGDEVLVSSPMEEYLNTHCVPSQFLPHRIVILCPKEEFSGMIVYMRKGDEVCSVLKAESSKLRDNYFVVMCSNISQLKLALETYFNKTIGE